MKRPGAIQIVDSAMALRGRIEPDWGSCIAEVVSQFPGRDFVNEGGHHVLGIRGVAVRQDRLARRQIAPVLAQDGAFAFQSALNAPSSRGPALVAPLGLRVISGTCLSCCVRRHGSIHKLTGLRCIADKIGAGQADANRRIQHLFANDERKIHAQLQVSGPFPGEIRIGISQNRDEQFVAISPERVPTAPQGANAFRTFDQRGPGSVFSQFPAITFEVRDGDHRHR